MTIKTILAKVIFSYDRIFWSENRKLFVVLCIAVESYINIL